MSVKKRGRPRDPNSIRGLARAARERGEATFPFECQIHGPVMIRTSARTPRCPECRRDEGVAYNANNRERIRVQARKWAAENRDYIRVRRAEWRQEKRSHIRAYHRVRYARLVLEQQGRRVVPQSQSLANRARVARANGQRTVLVSEACPLHPDVHERSSSTLRCMQCERERLTRWSTRPSLRFARRRWRDEHPEWVPTPGSLLWLREYAPEKPSQLPQ